MRVRNARDVGALIRDRRSALGWSQQDLADRCGASKRWVVAIEAGKPGAELELVLRSLSALCVDLDAVVADRPGSSDLDAFLDEIDAVS